jgi:hypothetical protein
MAPGILLRGGIAAKCNRTTGVSSTGHLGETQQQRRQQVVHCDAAIVATDDIARAVHLNKVLKTASGQNK